MLLAHALVFLEDVLVLLKTTSHLGGISERIKTFLFLSFYVFIERYHLADAL